MPAPHPRGAMLLLFDVATHAVAEHDHWHTHEHMPERLAIPGFVRGTRWTARDVAGRYCVLYEVAEPAVLDSAAYRERLDHPTPWTAAMMREYRGMRRALCAIVAGSGMGLGGLAVVVTFTPAPGLEAESERWLGGEMVPELAARPGFAACCLLRNTVNAPMTAEQVIRGHDATVHSALFLTAYDENALAAVMRNELAAERLCPRGIQPDSASCIYRQAYVLVAAEPGLVQ